MRKKPLIRETILFEPIRFLKNVNLTHTQGAMEDYGLVTQTSKTCGLYLKASLVYVPDKLNLFEHVDIKDRVSFEIAYSRTNTKLKFLNGI